MTLRFSRHERPIAEQAPQKQPPPAKRARRLASAWALALVTLGASACAHGPRGGVDPSAAGAGAVEFESQPHVEGWTRIVTRHQVSAAFPSNWDVFGETDVYEEDGRRVWEWRAEDPNTVYYLGVEELGGVIEPEAGNEFEIFSAFVQENLNGFAGELLGQKLVSLRGYSGIGYDIKVPTEEGDDYFLVGRMFLVGDRRVLAFAYTSDLIADEVELFLDSLELDPSVDERVLEAHGAGWGELVLGNAAMADGRRDEAVEWFTKAIQSGVFAEDYVGGIEDRRARMLFTLSRFAEALDAFDHARSLGYETQAALEIRAFMHEQNEDWGKAVEQYERLMENMGPSPRLLTSRLRARAGLLGQARARERDGTGTRGDVDVLMSSLSTDVDEALEAAPNDPELRVWRGLLRNLLGDRRGATVDFRRALASEPDRFEARVRRDLAQLEAPAPQVASAYAKWLAEQEPRDALLRRLAGEMWMAGQSYEDAKKLFDPLTADEYSSGELRCRTAILLTRMHRDEDAIASFARGLEADPRLQSCRNSYAWLLATSTTDGARDGARAVELAREFLFDGETRIPKAELQSSLVDTLAAAYAEAGRWEDAVDTQRLAIELAKGQGFTAKLLEEYEQRLQSYESRKPWRERYEEPNFDEE